MPKFKKKPSHSTTHRHQEGRRPHHHGGVQTKDKKKMNTFSRLSTTLSTASSQKDNKNRNIDAKEGPRKHQRLQQHLLPTIPFEKNDRILLIGEGDFSFARSLAEHHRCRYVCATCYDSKDVLYDKYPRAAEENINKFLGASADEAKGKREDKSNDKDEDEDEGLQKSEPAKEVPAINEEEEEQENGNDAKDKANNNHKDRNEKIGEKSRNPGRTVLFSVDARKLGTAAGGGKEIRHGFPRPGRHGNEKKSSTRGNHQRGPERSDNAAAGRSGGGGGPWDIICFNFPHVGGISTDVNRQVRANQELLVAFFKTCLPLLSASVPSVSDGDDDDEVNGPDRYDTESEFDDSNTTDDGSRTTVKQTEEKGRTRTVPKTRGQILVTLFEGEPYTLWNIRDLARHAGLQVVTSFRFPWKSYPGYSHSRTLGVVESRKGKRGGGWKGEDREARMYVFEVKGEEDHYPSMRGGKRAREDSSDEDD